MGKTRIAGMAARWARAFFPCPVAMIMAAMLAMITCPRRLDVITVVGVCTLTRDISAAQGLVFPWNDPQALVERAVVVVPASLPAITLMVAMVTVCAVGKSVTMGMLSVSQPVITLVVAMVMAAGIGSVVVVGGRV